MDAVTALVNCIQQTWGEKKMVGALFMDVKSAFNSVSRVQLGRHMEAFEIEPDLIRWAGSFMSDRQVKLILDGEVGEENPVDTGIPHGSPTAPVVFITYLSGIFDEVESAVPGVRA